MKKILFTFILICLWAGLSAQSTFRKGIKVGNPDSPTIIQIDSLTKALNKIKFYEGATQRYPDGVTLYSDTALMLNNYLNNSNISVTEAGYLNGVTSAIQTQIDGKITKGIIDSVNSVGTDAQFFSTTGDTLLPYIPYEDRITSNPYFKGQTNTDSLLIHGAYAERTTVNKLKIGGNNSPGTSATPAGDVAILLDSYMGTDTTMSANHIARIRSQNMMSSHYGSNLIFDTHTSLQDTYGGSTYLLPAMILDYNGSTIFPFRSTGDIGAGTGITNVMLARNMYYNGNAAIDITSDLQIYTNHATHPSKDGTVITIIGSSDVNTLKLDDGAGLQLAGGVSFTLGAGDVISLVYVQALTLWVELFRSDN